MRGMVKIESNILACNWKLPAYNSILIIGLGGFLLAVGAFYLQLQLSH